MQTHANLPTTDRPISATRTGSGESSFEALKNSVAIGMESAANKIRERTRRMNNERSALSVYSEKASRWLDTSSDYLKRHDIDEIKSDARTQIRRNPGTSLLIAGAAGLILGAFLRRR